jgi:hypothetical protein
MTDDIDHINAEIDRLTLQTTDPRPLSLFLERGKIQKRLRIWKVGIIVVSILAGVIALFAFFLNDDYGVPEAIGVALVTLVPITLIGRHDLATRTNAWLAQARQLVNGS